MHTTSLPRKKIGAGTDIHLNLFMLGAVLLAISMSIVVGGCKRQSTWWKCEVSKQQADLLSRLQQGVVETARARSDYQKNEVLGKCQSACSLIVGSTQCEGWNGILVSNSTIVFGNDVVWVSCRFADVHATDQVYSQIRDVPVAACVRFSGRFVSGMDGFGDDMPKGMSLTTWTLPSQNHAIPPLEVRLILTKVEQIK